MQSNPQRQKRRDGVLRTLDVTIEVLNLVKEICSVTPAKAVFGSTSTLLALMKESGISKQNYIKLGLSCAHICGALYQGLKAKRLDGLSQSVLGAVQKLAATVAKVEANIIKRNRRNVASRLIHSKNDKKTIATLKLDLNRILHIFDTELAINTNTMVADIHRNVSAGQGADGPVQSRIDAGELPPPVPQACFGRDELVERIVGLAEKLTPIALIGIGGIGKTSIALTVLHHDRVKERFGENRRVICCEQFTASCPNFLRQLSKAIGANVENPEDLTPLRSSLTSKEMLIVLDGAESILDQQGASAHAIRSVVEELSRIRNICLCITSHTATVHYKTFKIPTLSIEAAREAFYRIYKYNEQSDSVNNVLEQLDFHPLSVTLLATVAHQNNWDNKRLINEWKERQTDILQIRPNKSLARTIELSLASQMFRELGPDARGLLEVIAFFPQGIDENNFEWLFPSISNRTTIFDTFCVLSLTYRNDGFVTMLAPLRDYLRPRDPMTSSFLCATKDRYFTRMSIQFEAHTSAFRESQWIASEDVNVEHLLDVFTSINANSDDIWEACANFIYHLCWHKTRLTILRQKIEGLPNDHRCKIRCLFGLARLFDSVGNYAEAKRLLNHTLGLVRERGDVRLVALTLSQLSSVNRKLGLYEEAIQQAKEVSEICQQSKSLACTTELSPASPVSRELGPDVMACVRTPKFVWEPGIWGPIPRWLSTPATALMERLCRNYLRLPSCRLDVTFFSEGAFNKLYTIAIDGVNFGSDSPYTFVLRATSPMEPFYKTASEAATLSYILEHTSIPVPRVIAHYPTAENELELEWILMERLPGVALAKVWSNIDLETKRRLTKQIAGFARQLLDIQRRFTAIGNLYLWEDIDTLDVGVRVVPTDDKKYVLGPVVTPYMFAGGRKLRVSRDLGPYSDDAAYISALAATTIEDMKLLLSVDAHSYSDFDEDLAEEADDILQVLKELQTFSTTIFPSPPSYFSLNHHDLSLANILVDPRTYNITGIVDWESVGTRPHWEDIYSCSYVAQRLKEKLNRSLQGRRTKALWNAGRIGKRCSCAWCLTKNWVRYVVGMIKRMRSGVSLGSNLIG